MDMMRKLVMCFLAMSIVLALISTPAAAGEEDTYTLDKVVVLSRHNIRSPMSGSGYVTKTSHNKKCEKH